MELVNDNSNFAALGGHVPELLTVLLGWNVQLKTLDVTGSHVHRGSQQAHHAGAETEFVDANQGLHAFAMDVWVGLSVDHESFAGNHQAFIDRYLQIGELDTAMEASRERF